jgi:quaternary ammonium compound-resistance protein SugE
MSWLILFAAGLAEILMAVCFKYAEGWTKLGPSIGGILCAGLSMTLLTLALRGMPMSTGYAIWTGIGIAGVAIVGCLCFHENMPPLRILCLLVLLGSMVGLKLLDTSNQSDPATKPPLVLRHAVSGSFPKIEKSADSSGKAKS